MTWPDAKMSSRPPRSCARAWCRRRPAAPPDGEAAVELVHGADADGGGDVPPTRDQRAGSSHPLLSRPSRRATGPLTPPVRARHSGCPIDHQATTRAVNGYGFHRHARSCNVGRVPLDSVVSLVGGRCSQRLGRVHSDPPRLAEGHRVASCREIQCLEAAWFMAPRAAGACVSQKSCAGDRSAREIIENASRDSSKREQERGRRDHASGSDARAPRDH